jgi:hypothetical protein
MPESTPTRRSADRNLLLGILAFHNACVSRDTLIAGIQAWLEDCHPSGVRPPPNRRAFQVSADSLTHPGGV